MHKNYKKGCHLHRDEIVRWANSPKGTTVWYWNTHGSMWDTTCTPFWVEEVTYIVDDHQAELRKALYLDSSLQVEEFNPKCRTWESVTVTYKDIDPDKEYRIKYEFKRGDIVYVNGFAVKLLKVCGDEVEYLMPDATAYNTCTVKDIEGVWKPNINDFVYINGDVVKISEVNVADLLIIDSTGERTYIKHADIDRVWCPRCGEVVMVIEGATKTFLATVMYYLKDGTIKVKTKSSKNVVRGTAIAPYVGFEVSC